MKAQRKKTIGNNMNMSKTTFAKKKQQQQQHQLMRTRNKWIANEKQLKRKLYCMNWDSACAAGFWWRIYIVWWCWLNGWRASWMRYALAFYESNLLTSSVSVSLCMWMFVYLIPLFSFSVSITQRFPYLFFTKHAHAYTLSISFFSFFTYSLCSQIPDCRQFWNVCIQQIRFHKHKLNHLVLSVFGFSSSTSILAHIPVCVSYWARLSLYLLVSTFSFRNDAPAAHLAIGHIKIIENQDRNRKRHWNPKSASCDTNIRPGHIIYLFIFVSDYVEGWC